MKKVNSCLFLLCVLLAGMVIQKHFSSGMQTVYAQDIPFSSPAYNCNFGNSGDYVAYPCVQIILEIVPARLGGGIGVFRVEDTPFDVSQPNVTALRFGSINDGVTLQMYQPNSDVNTVTITAKAP